MLLSLPFRGTGGRIIMEISNLIPHIESLIFASDKPLTGSELTELINQAFGFMEDKIQEEQVNTALEGIVEKYNSEFYPFEVKQSGGGWQFLTKKEFHKTVAQLNGEKFLKKLSAAALETLAIIAYKQPITKGEIEAIRGVSSDYSVQKLLEKELILITGRNEKMPGHPLVYATSKNFMDYFGINSPEDLPKIREVLADQVVEPTIINHTDFEQSETLAISDEGELILNEPVYEDEASANDDDFEGSIPAEDTGNPGDETPSDLPGEEPGEADINNEEDIADYRETDSSEDEAGNDDSDATDDSNRSDNADETKEI
jgi:segregation and condensation protein B